MRKNKIQVGTKVVVFRRCRNWWNKGMDVIIGHTFTISSITPPKDVNDSTTYELFTKEAGVASGFLVSSDCLRVV